MAADEGLSSIDDQLRLSEDVKELLIEATKDTNRVILLTRAVGRGGLRIQTNRKSFVEDGDPRSWAKWQQVLQELLDQGLVKDLNGKGHAFEVMHKGFQIADNLVSSE